MREPCSQRSVPRRTGVRAEASAGSEQELHECCDPCGQDGTKKGPHWSGGHCAVRAPGSLETPNPGMFLHIPTLDIMNQVSWELALPSWDMMGE